MGRSSNNNGKKQKKQQKQNKKKNIDGATDNNNDGDMIWVDPARVRFQHSRIRPHFSGCGRSIHETLGSIRSGEISPSDLPAIMVIIGPETNEDPWYFSLNNRRLYVLKRCREEGLLESTNNQIQVRVRPPKSKAEAERYSLENCALEAKIMNEAKPLQKPQDNSQNDPNPVNHSQETGGKESSQDCLEVEKDTDMCPDNNQHTVPPTEFSSSDDEDSDDVDTDFGTASKNPFSALM